MSIDRYKQHVDFIDALLDGENGVAAVVGGGRGRERGAARRGDDVRAGLSEEGNRQKRGDDRNPCCNLEFVSLCQFLACPVAYSVNSLSIQFPPGQRWNLYTYRCTSGAEKLPKRRPT